MARHILTPLYGASFELDHDEYQERYDTLADQGYRLVHVDGFRSGSSLRYGGIWVRDDSAAHTKARHGLPVAQYQGEFDDLKARGFRLTSVTGLGDAGRTAATIAAVWNEGNRRGFTTHHGMTAQRYQEKFDELADRGYKAILVTGYETDNASRYAAIWSRHDERRMRHRHNLPASDYQATFDELKQQGYRIVWVNAHEAGGNTYFAGVWSRDEELIPAGRHNMSASTYESTSQEKANEDQRMTCMSGYREGNADRYAAVWIPNRRSWHVSGLRPAQLRGVEDAVESFMKDNNIPGASLAVARDGRVQMSVGLSWITDAERPVQPGSLFRVASLSKMLTGAAIVQLVERGQLALSDKVVNVSDMPDHIADARTRDIRIDHLLHHVGGWDRDIEPDPIRNDVDIAADLGVDLPLTRESLVRWANGRSLQFTPGTVDGYAYINYGYMLLGRVIEAVTGRRYEDYVREEIMAPLGIVRPRAGRTLIQHRQRDEVLYHSDRFDLRRSVMHRSRPDNVLYQYGGARNVEVSTASGGWIASATDMVRFASSFDLAKNPILNSTSTDLLFAEHAYGNAAAGSTSHYGCGWYVGRGGSRPGQYHGGTMEGTKAQLCRWSEGGSDFTAAVVFNTYRPDVFNDLDDLLCDPVEAVTSWPAPGNWNDVL